MRASILCWRHDLYLITSASYNAEDTIRKYDKKAQLTTGKRATAVFIWRLVFAISTLFDAPSWGKPCDINAIYTSLKSTFSGLQFRRWQYGFIYIRLAVIASETREISRNSKKIWPYSSSRSFKVIDLGVNGNSICDFLSVIVTLAVSATFSRYSRLKTENCWFTYPSLVW